jgi:hypothetical protein
MKAISDGANEKVYGKKDFGRGDFQWWRSGAGVRERTSFGPRGKVTPERLELKALNSRSAGGERK